MAPETRQDRRSLEPTREDITRTLMEHRERQAREVAGQLRLTDRSHSTSSLHQDVKEIIAELRSSREKLQRLKGLERQWNDFGDLLPEIQLLKKDVLKAFGSRGLSIANDVVNKRLAQAIGELNELLVQLDAALTSAPLARVKVPPYVGSSNPAFRKADSTMINNRSITDRYCDPE